jgi:hypothetical protein
MRISKRVHVALCVLLFALSALASNVKPTYTFDPYSLTHSWYSEADCKRTEHELVCKKATLEFGAMVYGNPQQKDSAAHGAGVTARQQSIGPVIVLFEPRKCKPAPPNPKLKNSLVRFVQRDAWECKNVTFRWVQQESK